MSDPMLPSGCRLGDYEVLRHLGSGSFGDVYKAAKCSDGSFVALKLCRTENREAGILQRLQHSGIVAVFEEFMCDRGHVTVMNFIDGVPLATLLAAVHRQPRRGLRVSDVLALLPETEDSENGHPHSWTEDRFIKFGCRIVLETALALEHAHAMQICHRDVKPENILVTQAGSAVLIDWGVAAGETSTNSITGGTLNYMRTEAVEVIAGLRTAPTDGTTSAKERDDIFALGIVLHELLAGDLPFPPATAASSVVVAARETLATRHGLMASIATNHEIPRVLRAILTACVCSDHDTGTESPRPYTRVQELAEDLQSFLHHRPLRHVAESPVVRIERWWASHRILWSTLLTLLLLLGGGFVVDRYRTSEQLAAVNRFRKQVLRDGISDENLPPEIELAVFDSGGFPDSQSLRHQRARSAHGLAAAYIAKGQPATAKSLLERAVQLHPENGELHHDLGTAFYDLKDFVSAISAFSQALEQKCEPAEVVLCHRGLAHVAMGNADAARADFVQALKIKPSDVAATKYLERLNSVSREPVH